MQTTRRVIYTLRMARHLIDLGFRPIAQVPNVRDITKDVWLFEDTPEFRAACEAYIANSDRAKQKEPPKPLKHDVTDEELSGLFLLGGQSIEDIARVHGVTIYRVMNAIQQDKRVQNAFAYALMRSDERAVADAVSQEERDLMCQRKLLNTDYEVSSSRGEFPHYQNGLHWQE